MAYRIALLLPLVAVLTLPARSNHIIGAEITWDCLGNNQYQVTFNLFRDCFGITPGVQETISIDSPCDSLDVIVTNVNIVEVSQLCPDDIVNSTCNGGTLPGIEQWIYTANVTLPPCDQWTMSWSACCRSTFFVNIGGGPLYVESALNNVVAPCDDAPPFNSVPTLYACANQPTAFAFGTVDPDGDQLGYAFAPALQGAGVPVVYNAGYSYPQPIPGITLDPVTGLVTFTPTLQGNYDVSVIVTEYDVQGNVIGSVLRSAVMIILPCSNTQPDPATGVITNLTGVNTQLGPYTIEMCGAEQFCFDFTISDADFGDALAVTTNVTSVLSGATISLSGTSPVSGTICWTAPATASGTYVVSMSAQDDACPFPGVQDYAYTINVMERTTAGPDITICGSQTAQLQAHGGTSFLWSAFSGDPIVVGVNFACNTCSDPVADPSITTSYIVESDLLGTCPSVDTVNVFVVPDFTVSLTQSDTLICNNEPVTFNTSVNPNAPGYTYSWTPSAGLSATNIPDPTGLFGSAGTYAYVLEITSPDGCVKVDSISVDVEFCSGIPEGRTAESITTYPNPANSTLIVELGNGGTIDHAGIVDQLGRTVLLPLSSYLGTSSLRFDVSRLRSGTYVLEILTGHHLRTGLVVIDH